MKQAERVFHYVDPQMCVGKLVRQDVKKERNKDFYSMGIVLVLDGNSEHVTHA